MTNSTKLDSKCNGKTADGPPHLTLPYADFSHALIRAHHDARAMAVANHVLADKLRGVLRLQQNLALELAETAFTAATTGQDASQAMFDRAVQAVRDVGEAIIDAQVGALRLLQMETDPNRTGFASPPQSAEETSVSKGL